MQSLAIADLPFGKRQRVRNAIQILKNDPSSYGVELRGHRLSQIDNDIVSIPIGHGHRLLCVAENGTVRPGALLTHEAYNGVMKGQRAFLDRIKAGTETIPDLNGEPQKMAVEPEPATESEAPQEIRRDRPIAVVVREWLKDRSEGFLFTKQDVINSRPWLGEDKYKLALSSCLHDFKKRGHIEDSGSRLGSDHYKLMVYRLTAAGTNMPVHEEATTIRGKILAWLKTRELGSTVTRVQIVQDMPVPKSQLQNLSNMLTTLKGQKLLPVVGHESMSGTKRKVEKYQITRALMDYWPSTPGEYRKNTTAAVTEPALNGHRSPHQIIAHIHRELHELKLLMKEKVQVAKIHVAKIHVAKLKTERVKKLTDYSAAELTAALTKVLKAAT